VTGHGGGLVKVLLDVNFQIEQAKPGCHGAVIKSVYTSIDSNVDYCDTPFK
jgi:hypothetical protein